MTRPVRVGRSVPADTDRAPRGAAGAAERNQKGPPGTPAGLRKSVWCSDYFPPFASSIIHPLETNFQGSSVRPNSSPLRSYFACQYFSS